MIRTSVLRLTRTAACTRGEYKKNGREGEGAIEEGAYEERGWFHALRGGDREGVLREKVVSHRYLYGERDKQIEREKSMNEFKSGESKILVATTATLHVAEPITIKKSNRSFF